MRQADCSEKRDELEECRRIGVTLHSLASELFPICRSITGNGVRETLAILQRELPALKIHEVPSGTRAFDWTVPAEWNVRDAYVVGPAGEKVIDFKRCNLHLVGYSIPVDVEVSLEELQKHLYSLESQPDAVPYVTSYYQERWGFCLTHREREKLEAGKYRVRVDSTLEPGHLTYGELLVPGETEQEVFLSTYVCHPSMANNEVSGPTVTTHLARWLGALPRRKYSYRIVFIPETIGSITYLSRNLRQLKERVIAGFNISCVGDDRAYSYLPSRRGDSLADRVAKHVLSHIAPDYRSYSFLDRGSDERQYCSPGVDLPVASMMRTKYGEYPEYHTSLDDLSVVTPNGLAGAYEMLQKALLCMERNEVLTTAVPCEPQLGKRGLYPTLSTRDSAEPVRRMSDLIAYADGTRDLLQIAETIGAPMWELFDIVDTLRKEALLL